MERIPISGPWITQREVDYVTDAAANAWYSNHAMYHVRFEAAFAEYLGVKHAVSLPSCTSGLHLALAALGVGPGDEVVVPDCTWIATSAPIAYVGATPVFADMDDASWCLSPQALEAVITPRTRAVIVVDLYGNMPDWEGIRRVADRHGIALIEDAAEAIGSEHDGRRAGSLGDVAAFSFHGSKTLTTGEGGMLVTDDSALFEQVMILRDHGRVPGDTLFFNDRVGFKYKMSSMQAAIGLAQIERVEELVEKKRAIFGWYRDRLAGTDGITLNSEAANVRNTYWMVTAVLDPSFRMDKIACKTRLAEHGVDSRPFFHPLSLLPAYRETEQARVAAEQNVVSYRISPWGINLPSGLSLDESLVDRVCEALLLVLGLRSR